MRKLTYWSEDYIRSLHIEWRFCEKVTYSYGDCELRLLPLDHRHSSEVNENCKLITEIRWRQSRCVENVMRKNETWKPYGYEGTLLPNGCRWLLLANVERQTNCRPCPVRLSTSCQTGEEGCPSGAPLWDKQWRQDSEDLKCGDCKWPMLV